MTEPLPDASAATPPAHPAKTPALSEDLAAQLEQVMQADRDFFLQHPGQDYYIRSITPVEVMEGRSMGQTVTEAAYVLVGEIAPGSRLRLTFVDPEQPPIEDFQTARRQIQQRLGKSADRSADKSADTPDDRLKDRKHRRPRAQGFG